MPNAQEEKRKKSALDPITMGRQKRGLSRNGREGKGGETQSTNYEEKRIQISDGRRVTVDPGVKKKKIKIGFPCRRRTGVWHESEGQQGT